jgi:hypothetical protein
MYLNEYARLVAITLAIAFFAACRPAFSQCAAYPWNAPRSVRGGCRRPGARCTVPGSTRPLSRCTTKFPLNPNERECECGFLLRLSATGEDVKLVRAFQREHALVPDGVVGQQTWDRMNAVAAPLSK